MPSNQAESSQEIMIANEEVRRQTILNLTLKIRVSQKEKSSWREQTNLLNFWTQSSNATNKQRC